MTESLTTYLVGAHFRPPAKIVLQHLPSSTLLTLIPEPENPYDDKAIKVIVATSAIPPSQHSELETKLLGCGWTLEQLIDTPSLHLGYIPRNTAKCLIGNEQIGNMIECARTENGPDLNATLTFDGAGKPQVRVTLIEARVT